MAQDFNLQDGLILQSDSLSFIGEQFVLGTGAGAKSIVLSNNVGAVFFNANPTANHTIALPDADGTVGLITALSAGTTFASSGAISFANSNGISFGFNGNTLTANHVDIAEISAGTTAITSGTVSFANSNGISFGINGQTITGSVVQPITLRYFNPMEGASQVTIFSAAQGTLYIAPFQPPNLSFDRIVFPVTGLAAAADSVVASISLRMGIYTLNASTLSLFLSTSASFTNQTWANSNSSLGLQSYNGIRNMTISWATSLSQGQYWAGIVSSSNTADGLSLFPMLYSGPSTGAYSGLFGVLTSASMQYSAGLGIFSAATNGMPASIAIAGIRGSVSLQRIAFAFSSGTF